MRDPASFLPSDNESYSRQSLRDTGDDTTGVLVLGHTLRSHRWTPRHVNLDDAPRVPAGLALLVLALIAGSYLALGATLADDAPAISAQVHSTPAPTDDDEPVTVGDPDRDRDSGDRADRSQRRGEPAGTPSSSPSADHGPDSPTARPARAPGRPSSAPAAPASTKDCDDDRGSASTGPSGSQVPGVDSEPGSTEPAAGSSGGGSAEPGGADGPSDSASPPASGTDNGGSDVGAGDSGGDEGPAGSGSDGEPSAGPSPSATPSATEE